MCFTKTFPIAKIAVPEYRSISPKSSHSECSFTCFKLKLFGFYTFLLPQMFCENAIVKKYLEQGFELLLHGVLGYIDKTKHLKRLEFILCNH